MANQIRGIPTRLFAYIAATAAVGLPAIALLAELRPMPMGDGGKQDVSIANVFTITVAIVFGWRYAVPLAALTMTIAMISGRRPLVRIIFNVAQYAITALAASLPVIIFGVTDSTGAGRLTAYILGGALMNMLTNTLLVGGVIS